MNEQRALTFNGKYFEEIKDDDIGSKKIIVFDNELNIYKERLDEEGFPFITDNGDMKQFLEPNKLLSSSLNKGVSFIEEIINFNILGYYEWHN